MTDAKTAEQKLTAETRDEEEDFPLPPHLCRGLSGGLAVSEMKNLVPLPLGWLPQILASCAYGNRCCVMSSSIAAESFVH